MFHRSYLARSPRRGRTVAVLPTTVVVFALVLAVLEAAVCVTGRAVASPSGRPMLLRDVNPVPPGAYGSPVAIGSTLYFTGFDHRLHSLWRSDGTAARTRRVHTFPKGQTDRVRGLAVVNGRLFFAGYDTAHGEELWRSDGTTAGTVLVRDLTPGRGGSSPYGFVALGGALYFFTHSGGLWRSDGTAAGTVRIKTGLSRGASRVVGDTLFFFMGRALWKSDGTTAGTRLVITLPSAAPLVQLVSNLTGAGGKLFFVRSLYVEDESDAFPDSYELWVSDGTAAGTSQVKNLVDGGAPAGTGVAALGDAVYFFTDGGLWRSDGTRTGTSLVADTGQGNVIFRANHKLFFFSDAGLYRSDGTAAGTVLLHGGVYGYQFIAVGDHVFFTQRPAEDFQLWVSDGTAGGTRQVAALDGYFSMLSRVAGTLFFIVTTDGKGSALWKTSGHPGRHCRGRDDRPADRGFRADRAAARRRAGLFHHNPPAVVHRRHTSGARPRFSTMTPTTPGL